MAYISGKRVTFTNVGKVELLTHEVPKPGPDEILVETVCTAISPGTELSRLYDYHMAPKPFPQNTGYLSCARVMEVGENVEGVETNRLYVVNIGHLSHHVVTKDKLFPVPENVLPEHGAFTNLLAVSLRAVRQAEVALGQSVLIFGLGLIGQFAQMFSKINGATRIAVVDPSARRRLVAKETGLKNVFDSSEIKSPEDLNQVTDDGRFNTVIDSTGVASVVGGLPQYVTDFGNLIILGGVHEPVAMDLYTHIQKRSLRLIGAGTPDPHNFPFHNITANQQTILDLMSNGTLDMNSLVSHVDSVENAPDLYRMLYEEKDKALGVALRWNQY